MCHTVSIDTVRMLQREVLSLQGMKRTADNSKIQTGLSIIEQAFPNKIFPTAAVHEFISHQPEHAAATNGFMSGIIGKLMHHDGVCIWVSQYRTVFPAALKLLGVSAEKVFFIDVRHNKEAIHAVEEALKCKAVAVVVGEIGELSFKESRRLQLAVEESKTTGFIHRYRPRTENTVACVTRWKIKPVASEAIEGLPGLGFPRWDVQLLKVRNGKPGNWMVEWANNSFNIIPAKTISISQKPKIKTG